ncbi:Mbov_0400 family ICE element protein [Mycoplasma sp. 1890]
MSIYKGTIWKIRDKQKSLFPIGRNIGKQSYFQHDFSKVDRPYVIFIASDKVFYLSVKTLSEKNKVESLKDKTNIILKNGIYNDNHPSVINTRAINVMDKDLFFSLYELDNEKNNVFLSQEIYDKIMLQIQKNIEASKFEFFEISKFANDQHPIWESKWSINKYKDFIHKAVSYYNLLDSSQKQKIRNECNFDNFDKKSEKENNYDDDLELEL